MILGTRGSALALTQTDMVTAALEAAHPGLAVSREIIQTTGDLRQDLRLGRPDSGADKAVWTKELEAALADGRIDAAVHSGKDVPTELPANFRLVSCLPRAAVNDVLVSKHAGGFSGLPEGATVATSSVRRLRELRWQRPDLHVVEMRGNVPTRLQKLADQDELDAILLAQAGLDRLGYTLAGHVSHRSLPAPFGLHATALPAGEFLPAASQGIVVLEVLGEDAARDARLTAIRHEPTWRALAAERHLLHLLHAGCHTPIGVLTDVRENGSLHMRAVVFDELDADAPPRQGEAEADDPLGCAARLVSRLSLSPPPRA